VQGCSGAGVARDHVQAEVLLARAQAEKFVSDQNNYAVDLEREKIFHGRAGSRDSLAIVKRECGSLHSFDCV
jgi:hypothetical protein